MPEYKLFHGDCLDILPTLEAGSIDLVLTDPPYGISINKKNNNFGIVTNKSRKKTKGDWDDSLVSSSWISDCFRISANQIIFGANYFIEHLYSSPCYIVWDKRGNLPDVPFCPTEWAWTSFDKMSKKYTVLNHGFIRDSNEERTGHPTQKPLLLMEKIILDFTKEGDTILDPFMGSGSTGVACMRTGRNFYGIELDAGYFTIAETRIKNANNEFVLTEKEKQTGQMPLFPV